MDNISVDTEELAKQLRESSQKGGFSIKVWIPPITEEDIIKGGHVTPLVDLEGNANPVTFAFAVKTLKLTAKQLRDYEGVDEALEVLEQCIGGCRSTMIENKKGDKDD